MGQVGSNKYQIAISIVGDIVCDKPFALALYYKSEFEFRMEMPVEAKTRIGFHAIDEGRPLRRRQFLDGSSHVLRLLEREILGDSRPSKSTKNRQLGDPEYDEMIYLSMDYKEKHADSQK